MQSTTEHSLPDNNYLKSFTFKSETYRCHSDTGSTLTNEPITDTGTPGAGLRVAGSIMGYAFVQHKTSSAHGHPQAWARGGTCPPPLWKCFNLFLCSNSYSKTFGRITYTLFSQPVVGLATGTSPSNPIGDPSMDHAWGLSSPAQSPNLPTPGKILWAPMHQTHFHNKMNCNSFSSKFSSLLQKFYQSRPF